MPVYDSAAWHEVRRDLYFGRGIRAADRLREGFRALGLTAPVLIKVNWFSPYPGQFTDAATLALVCDAIVGEKVVLEGHAAMRNDLSREVEPGKGRAQWAWLREQERAYFARFGLDAVLARDDVTYVNVTDEVWTGDVVAAAETRSAVAARGGALAFDELAGVLPAKLLPYRGRPLLSLARVKIPSAGAGTDAFAFSLSLKNMFGLIPEPNRGAYHERLPAAVVDVHLLYGAYFPIYGVCEAVFHAVRVSDGGRYDTAWGDRYDDLEGLGLVVAGAKPAEVDGFTAALFGVDVSARALMREAEARLGGWDKMVVLEAARFRSIV